MIFLPLLPLLQSRRKMLRLLSRKTNAELVSLASENAKLEARIEAAKKKNADQGKELFKTPDEFPVEVSALISCL